MRVFVKDPGKYLVEKDLPNTLEALQEAVGGYIEVVPIFKDMVMIVNEEGKIRKMDYNFHMVLLRDDIFGPAVFAGVKGDEFTDVPKVATVENIKEILPGIGASNDF